MRTFSLTFCGTPGASIIMADICTCLVPQVRVSCFSNNLIEDAFFVSSYFVTHFKTCHLKNVLYRFNGHTEEENQRVRFGPRRKKDATAWFSQLKSTEKRMVREAGPHGH